jgi:hypothetical protein
MLLSCMSCHELVNCVCNSTFHYRSWWSWQLSAGWPTSVRLSAAREGCDTYWHEPRSRCRWECTDSKISVAVTCWCTNMYAMNFFDKRGYLMLNKKWQDVYESWTEMWEEAVIAYLCAVCMKYMKWTYGEDHACLFTCLVSEFSECILI